MISYVLTYVTMILGVCIDFYLVSTGKYAYSTKYSYTSTANSVLTGSEMKYTTSGCTGTATTTTTVSLPTSCTAESAYMGIAFGYSSSAWSSSSKGLYLMEYPTSSCTTPYGGTFLYSGVCYPTAKKASQKITCTSTVGTMVKYTSSSTCTVRKDNN